LIAELPYTANSYSWQGPYGSSWSSQSVPYRIQKHIHYLGLHCLSKYKLGPVATCLLILRFPTMNYFYFVGLFNVLSRSIV